MKKVKVNMHTSVVENGKVVVCPKCGSANRMFSFSWKNMQCKECHTLVDKCDWFIQENDMIRYKRNSFAHTDVFLYEDHVGSIISVSGGYQYIPKLSESYSKVFATIDEVKQNLERD